MDINSLKINLGDLERFTEQARRGKAVSRSSVEHILSMVEDQQGELDEFMDEVDRVVKEVREACRV